jgi:hypothetical protein
MAEFALRRPLKAFYDGFAVVPLGALGSDQNVMWRFHAVFETIKTCDFHKGQRIGVQFTFLRALLGWLISIVLRLPSLFK